MLIKPSLKIPHNLPPLRDYQTEVDEYTWSHYGISTVIQLPTGTGKGLLISKFVLDCVVRKLSVLIVVPSIFLVDNIYNRLIEYCPFLKSMIGTLATGRGKSPNFPIVIAVYKSIAKRLSIAPFFHVVIGDEVHHAMSEEWLKIAYHYDKSWHVGYTATPERLDGKPLGNLYSVLYKSKPVRWFIDNGYLADYTIYTWDAGFRSGSQKSFNDDLSNQQKYFDRGSIMGDAIREWEEKTLGYKTLFFCTGIDHARHTAQAFNEKFGKHFKFGYIGSDQSTKERKDILAAFSEGHFTGLTNVGIVTEGIDIPSIDCVSFLRFTQSIPLYLQMAGRGLRPTDKRKVFLDHAGNAREHGSPEYEHEWELFPELENEEKENTDFRCENCAIPLVTRAKVGKFREKGFDMVCPGCGTSNHFEHIPEERSERGEVIKLDGVLVEYEGDNKIELRLKKIIESKYLREHKVKRILNVTKATTPQKIRALRSVGCAESAIQVYLNLP